jgi:hypothetical protein
VADCYRIIGDGDGHYFFEQVLEPFDGIPVSCNLLHGRYSSDPGMFITGVPVAEILTCDCGTLQFPGVRGFGREYSNVPSNAWKARYDLVSPQ